MIIPFAAPELQSDVHELVRSTLEFITPPSIPRIQEMGSTTPIVAKTVFDGLRLNMDSAIMVNTYDFANQSSCRLGPTFQQVMTFSITRCAPPPTSLVGKSNATWKYCKDKVTLALSQETQWTTPMLDAAYADQGHSDTTASTCYFSDGAGFLVTCCPTVFRAIFQQTIIQGAVTFQWTNFASQTMSFCHTAFTFWVFLFPTTIIVPYYYKWGKRRSQYTAVLEPEAGDHLLSLQESRAPTSAEPHAVPTSCGSLAAASDPHRRIR
eukprot:TRINITY_DN68444_c0_g1_i1.p1 TRINITY_DN68444_c0_g1~~TRINITY_DN68444_c0_g1_i1.p1  ORF type:complete len:266 (+),score=-0.27 TRINITY_DN68444_c0_g1_i1:143-940(+)